MIIIGLVILGLCLGSFINAFVYRLHWREEHPKAANSERAKYSIRSGRSLCPHCGHMLGAKDLIPLFSWLILAGKCRYCNQPISPQYPLVEASTVLLFVFSYLFWPYDLSSGQNAAAFALWLVFVAGFMILTIYDIKYMILPNKVIFPLIFIAILGVVISALAAQDTDIIKSSIIGMLIGGGLFYVLFQVSKGSWIGGGDVKLGFLLGLLVGGPWPALLMLFLASLLGTVYSLPMMFTKKIGPKSRIPFGPFLIMAAIIVQLFGTSIINHYLSLYNV